MVISTVTGTFKTFEGTLDAEGDKFDQGKVNFTVDTASIDTNVADRDAHLKSADFFDSEKFPKMIFSNATLRHMDGDSYELKGSLTIKDVTKEITLKANYGGTMVDGYGNTKVGFEVEGKINRKDFGLTWSMVTEAGGVVVGDEVRLIFNIQLIKA